MWCVHICLYKKGIKTLPEIPIHLNNQIDRREKNFNWKSTFQNQIARMNYPMTIAPNQIRFSSGLCNVNYL